MKSPLVEALRQAQDAPDSASSHVLPEDAAEPVSESQGETDSPSGSPTGHDVGELNLLATGVLEHSVSDASVAEGREALPDEANATEDPATEQVPNDVPLMVPALQLDGGAGAGQPRSLIAQIGRFSPLICFLSMSLSAGAFVLYQSFAVVTLNEDLKGVSEQVRTDRHDGNFRSKWTAIVPSDSSASPAETNKLIEEIYSSGDVTSASAISAQASNNVDRGSIEIVVSDGSKNEFDDRAFEKVAAGYEAYRAQDYPEAEVQYRAALVIEPNHRNALSGLAAVLQKTSRASESIQYYERLLRIDPDDTVAAAAILVNQASDSEIESSLKLLLQRHPEAGHLHFALGSHLVGLQRWPEARLAFLNAHHLSPGNANYSYNLAVTMEQSGQYDEALGFYEIALATASEDSLLDRHTIEEHISKLATITREPT